MYYYLLLDSNLYAHFVFKAFDVKSNGAISFKVSLYGIYLMIIIYIYLLQILKYDANNIACRISLLLGY